MENASKALIIAGAILISILLISIGIILINSGRDITETGTQGMNSQKIQTFNAQFTAYEGTKKGSEIRGIFNTREASNATDEAHQVVFGTDSITKAANLVATKNYTVKLTYHDSTCGDSETSENGYICTIKITEAS